MKGFIKNEKTYTELEYRKYMMVLDRIITHTECGIQSLEKNKKVSKLSYEQWVDWQSGKVKLDEINEGQMTAVQYLKQQYIERGETLPSGVFQEALEMEQKQMKEMYLKGIENYDPTFKRKSQWTEVDNMTRRLK